MTRGDIAMPAGFDKCVAGGGRVRTKKLGGGKFMRICFDSSGSHAGEVKTKKSSSSRGALTESRRK